jgi:Ni2+-binding GTPase involved in maturation of urease and hydrogenase
MPFLASMVIGTPGSGKSFSVVQPFIRQHLKKGFSMCVYDLFSESQEKRKVLREMFGLNICSPLGHTLRHQLILKALKSRV